MGCDDPQWAYLKNGQNDLPCVVAGKVGQFCNTPNQPPQLSAGGQYSPPPAGSNQCHCSSAYYYVVSACALCQGGTWPSWASWSINCPHPVLGPLPQDTLTPKVVPSFGNQVPSSTNPTFVDPNNPNPPPPPPPKPTTRTTPPATPTATTTPAPTAADPNPASQSSSLSSNAGSSSTESTSGTDVSSASTTDSSADASSTITLSLTSTHRALVTGAAGFSADPNDPNNPSPSISPLDGSTNSGSGALAEKKGSNAGAIVGGVIGAIALIILLGGAVYWFRTRRRRGSLAPSAAYIATYGRPETVMSQRPYTDRSTTPLHSIYPEAPSPYSDELRESVHSYNMEGVTAYNGPQRNISPTYFPTR